jgi:hypothetical protein
MTTARLVLEFLKWEYERVADGRAATLQVSAVLVGLIGVAAVLLATVVVADNPPRLTSVWFTVFTAGIVLLGYGGYLVLRSLTAKRTLVRELLGPAALQQDGIPAQTLAVAEDWVARNLMLVVSHNQRDLIERRRLLNRGMWSFALAILLIGLALWYTIPASKV